MLEEFKTDEILITHANETITKTFMAKMGDSSGRVLQVQVTNEGEIVDMTGYNVYLLWSHESGNHKGIEVFEAVDATQGVFNLEYPATMLNHSGVLQAYIQVVSPENAIINTLNFRIYVQSDNGVMGDTEAKDLYETFKQLMANFEEMMNASGLKILGYYESEAQLKEEHPTGAVGDAYLVGSDLYIWQGSEWVNTGRIKGEKGDQGEQGVQGVQGEDGKAATVEVGTVTTGEAGSQAVVNNSGTANAAILDFTIPRGDKGDKGDTGEAATIDEVTVTTGEPNTQATVENTGTATNARLHFTIPRGEKGETGDGGVPAEGETGQVLTKTETGAEWADPIGGEDSYLLTGGTEIPANADLNDYSAVGNYYCPLNATAATLKNSPTTTAFVMKVALGTGNGYPQQELITYDTGRRYTRTFSEGQWQIWYNSFQTGDVLAPEYGGVPINSGTVGQVLTKTEAGQQWQDPTGVSGDYLPTSGGTLSGNVTVDTGTAEPNVILKRTVDDSPCELAARIDSEAKAGLRYKVSGATVNELILEQTQTRLRKPLNAASGGVPMDGTEGQVLTKGASGHAWADLPDILDPQEIRDMISAPVIEVQGETAKLKAPDETPVLLGIEGGGTGAETAEQALENLGAAAKSHKHTKADISDFPISMPASDVSEWAKADSKPSYTAEEVGAAPSSHTHEISDVKELQNALDEKLTIPTGGTEGQVLTKTADGEEWQDAKGGGSDEPIQAGIIYPFAGSTVPNGFLLCDGQAVSRTTYAELFSVIGTTYGEGDGSTTFNLPDLKGKFGLGSNDAYALGSEGGEAEHTLTVDEMPQHNHSASTSSAGAHVHGARYKSFSMTQTTSGYAVLRRNQSGDSYDGTDTDAALSAGSHTHTVSVGNAGGGQAHNNMPPYTAINYIISTGKETVNAIAKASSSGIEQIEISNVNGLQSALDNKANATHTHTTNDVSNMYSGFAEHAAMEAYNVFTLTVSDLGFDPRNAKIFLADMSAATNPGEKCSQVAICNMTENSFQIMGYAGTGAIKIGWTAIV